MAPLRASGGLRREVLLRAKAQAIAFAAGANATHGLRRTTSDKRRAVTKLLSDLRMADRTDRAIAELAGVDHKTVASVWSGLQRSGEIPQNDERIGTDGRVVKVDPTANQADLPENEEEVNSEEALDAFDLTVPEEFELAFKATEGFEAGVRLLEGIEDDAIGFGYSQLQMSALAQQLRIAADRIEAVAAERPSDVPDDEQIQKLTIHLNRYIKSVRSECHVEAPPARKEDGTWCCGVKIGRRKKTLQFSDDQQQWLSDSA